MRIALCLLLLAGLTYASYPVYKWATYKEDWHLYYIQNQFIYFPPGSLYWFFHLENGATDNVSVVGRYPGIDKWKTIKERQIYGNVDIFIDGRKDAGEVILMNNERVRTEEKNVIYFSEWSQSEEKLLKEYRDASLVPSIDVEQPIYMSCTMSLNRCTIMFSLDSLLVTLRFNPHWIHEWKQIFKESRNFIYEALAHGKLKAKERNYEIPERTILPFGGRYIYKDVY